MKQLATRDKYRGLGLGTDITTKLIEDAEQHDCLVLAADVTTTNAPSQKIFEKSGFEKVNSFCWRKGETPSNILHFVLLPPGEGKC